MTREKLYIIKIGGNIIDDDARLVTFLEDFASIKAKKILVHGGGKSATALAQKMGFPQQLVDGRRITDAETLKLVTMVYAGLINKKIVAGLQSFHCNALGLTGADANIITAHKRVQSDIDYGFAGDIDNVNKIAINHFLQEEFSLIIAPITHDQQGQLLNTNADTVAQSLAVAMSKLYEVNLIYCFEKQGVLMDMHDENSAIKIITISSYANLKTEKIISDGMIPKLDNAFAAIKDGVQKVVIGSSADLLALVDGKSGTQIIHE